MSLVHDRQGRGSKLPFLVSLVIPPSKHSRSASLWPQISLDVVSTWSELTSWSTMIALPTQTAICIVSGEWSAEYFISHAVD